MKMYNATKHDVRVNEIDFSQEEPNIWLTIDGKDYAGRLIEDAGGKLPEENKK